jgi:hypothetical protein
VASALTAVLSAELTMADLLRDRAKARNDRGARGARTRCG